jgi:hypothetical protein
MLLTWWKLIVVNIIKRWKDLHEQHQEQGNGRDTSQVQPQVSVPKMIEWIKDEDRIDNVDGGD